MSTAVRYTFADFVRALEQGEFDDRRDSDRFELIHGEIRDMSPANPPHDSRIEFLNYWSIDNTSRNQVRARIQSSLGIATLDSVTVPDVAWMRARDYSRVWPKPRNVLLLIEVSASSLAFDRGEKAELYATPGIKDYWIVNVSDEVVEVHRKPRGGKYREVTVYRHGEPVSPLAAPAAKLDPATLFGEA